MTDNDLSKFKILISGTAGIMGTYIPPESIPLYFSDLIKYELPEIELAIESYRKDTFNKVMPSSGQIIYQINLHKKKPVEFVEMEKQPIPDGVIEKIFAELGTTQEQKQESKLNPPNENDPTWNSVDEIIKLNAKLKGESRR